MIVSTRGRIDLDLRRIIDIEGSLARLEPITPGTEEMQSPIGDLQRYRIRTTDDAHWEGKRVSVLRCVNPRDLGLYEYEIEEESGERHVVREFYLLPSEGAYPPDPSEQLCQLDGAPWDLVSARNDLLESYFAATARSLGLAGYQGARMFPIPHQLNAARYAILFGRVRFILADEVGLGKTVEAGLIVSTLKKYFPEWRTGIFVPQSLTVQWAYEMYGKFGKQIFALDERDLDEETPGVILPHTAVERVVKSKFEPEILVVDEAHRVLRDKSTWDGLRKMSEKAHAVLLLTATPRSDDADNVCRLLRLCDPERFDQYDDDEDIQDLLEQQAEVEEVVQTLRNHEATAEEIEAAWEELLMPDPEIDDLVRTRNEDGEPDRHAMSHAAALLVDRYYPGARILRYQRKFLARDNAMAMRIFDQGSYTATEEERKVGEGVRAWLDLIRKNDKIDDEAWREAAAALLQASFSSPLAVSDWIAARRGELEPREGVTADPIRLAVRRNLSKLKMLPGEEEVLQELFLENRQWFGETRHDRAAALPLALLPRYRELVSQINGLLELDPASRLLVFTSFEANAKPLAQLLKREFTGRADIFHIDAGQPWRAREKSAFAFQEHETACVLVSDELGGEGRNFQFAHAIIHFDLPLAPWLIEQRIGRCDRVGRDEELDVESIVLASTGGLDEAIFEFLADGVNVFNESIAPIEGSMARINRLMLHKCIEEGAEGVVEMIESVHEELEEAREEHEQELLSRSRIGVVEARSLAERVDDTQELETLRDAAINYARLFESKVDTSTAKTHITVGEFHSLRGEAGVLPEMYGHFDRRNAVRHERLEFFSPGHPFVRGLALRALQDQPDRTAFVVREGLDRPVFVFGFLFQLAPEFFGAIRELPVDLRPPLFCKSAEAFGTRLVRIAVDFEGNLLPDDDDNALVYQPAMADDDSMHDGPLVDLYLPAMWRQIATDASDIAYEKAEALAAERLKEGREAFEDLLCEVLTRVFPTQEWLESTVTGIMDKLARLEVELDSAVVLFPPIPDEDDDRDDEIDPDDDDLEDLDDDLDDL